MPKGYVIITEDVKDPAGMAEYGKLAGKAMAGATLLSFDPAAETLEGEWHGTQTVLLEFESVEAAQAVVLLRRLPGGGQAPAGRGRLQRRHRLRPLDLSPKLTFGGKCEWSRQNVDLRRGGQWGPAGRSASSSSRAPVARPARAGG